MMIPLPVLVSQTVRAVAVAIVSQHAQTAVKGA
jgi:hypothetical protein